MRYTTQPVASISYLFILGWIEQVVIIGMVFAMYTYEGGMSVIKSKMAAIAIYYTKF